MAKHHIAGGCLLFFLVTPAGFSQNDIIDPDTGDQWNVLLLPPAIEEGGGLYFGFLEVLQDSLSHISQRSLLRSEAEGYQQSLWEETIRKEQKQYTALTVQRDALVFSEETTFERWGKRRDITKQLKLSRRRLDELRTANPLLIPLIVERTLNVQILEEKYPVSNVEIANYAKKNNIHQVFSFRSELITDYQRVTIHEYNRYRDEHREIFQRPVQSNELASLIDVFVLTLAHRVLGYQVASLVIRAVDSNDHVVQTARIYINGSFNGIGEYARTFQKVGTLEVEIETAEKKIIKRILTLIPEEQRTVSILIETPQVAERIQLLSIPSGVGVYFESRWIGRTPLAVGQSNATRYLQFIKEGYLRSWTLLRPNHPDLVTIQMIPDTRDLQKELEKKREEFYTSIIMLAVSVPFPIVFSALSQSQQYYLNAPLPAAQRSDIQRSYLAYYGTFWGTLGVTLGFTGYMIYRLADYITFADRLKLESK